MCTLVILRRPGHRWPLIIAANRDEMADRPWLAPGRHWPDRAEVVAGRDLQAGGSWLGINDSGVVAGVLNRHGSLGAGPGVRSRGELVLEALDHADACDAAEALADLDGNGWRSFNMVIADNRDAYWLKSADAEASGRIQIAKIPDGLAMLTAHDLDDPASPRIRFHLPRFRAAAAPVPETGDWREWADLMANRDHDPAAGSTEAMTIVTDYGFQTLSSSLIALAAPDSPPPRKIWLFCAGRPGQTDYEPVDI
jgi:uncharacterized protein with NRDE domain